MTRFNQIRSRTGLILAPLLAVLLAAAGVLVSLNGVRVYRMEEGPWETGRRVVIEESTSSTRNAIKFSFDEDATYGIVDLVVYFSMWEGHQPEDAVEAVVTAPDGHRYPPWRVTTDEPCHDFRRIYCKDGITHLEQVVLHDPQPGVYILEAYPAGTASSFPAPLVQLNARQFHEQPHNSPTAGGDDLWWYYPDHSVRHVQNGFWPSPSEYLWQVVVGIPAGILAVGVGAWIAVAALRGWRKEAAKRGKES